MEKRPPLSNLPQSNLNNNDTNFTHGRDAGQQDVTANPANYNLYSKTQYDTNYENGYFKGKADGIAEGLKAEVVPVYHVHRYTAKDGTLKSTSQDDYTKISDFAPTQGTGSCFGTISTSASCQYYQVTQGEIYIWDCSGCGNDRARFQHLDEIHVSCGGTRTGIGGRHGCICIDHGSADGTIRTHTYTRTSIGLKCGKLSSTVESYTLKR